MKDNTTVTLSNEIGNYVRAMYTRNGIVPKTEMDDDDIEFGVDSAEDIRKKHARKKKKSPARVVKIDDKLRESLYRVTLPTDEDIDRLRVLAKQALASAESEAGSKLKYCCGLLRPLNYVCPLDGEHNTVYDEVNSW